MPDRWFKNTSPHGAVDFSTYIEARKKEALAKLLVANPDFKPDVNSFGWRLDVMGAEGYTKEFQPAEP